MCIIFFNIEPLSESLKQLMISVLLQLKYLSVCNETEILLVMINCLMNQWKNVGILLIDINFQSINNCFDFKSFIHLLNSFQ